MSLTRLWVLLRLQVLLTDVCPVAQTALHDTLDESDLLRCSPFRRQQREVQVVKDVECMCRLMLWIIFGGFTEAQTLQAHDELGFCAIGCVGRCRRLTLSTEDFDALGDVTLTQRANLRSKQVLRLLEACS